MLRQMQTAALALAMTAGAASAATLLEGGVDSGETFLIPAGHTLFFDGDVQGDGGPGEWEVEFTVEQGGTGFAQLAVTFFNVAPGRYADIMLAWDLDDDATNGVLSSVMAPVAGLYSLGTSFGPGSLTQYLRVSWTDSPDDAGTLSLSGTITAIPLPAAGLMLMGAMGGLAALRRRRKA